MKKADIKSINPNDFIDGINTGKTIFDAVFPLIKEAFKKVSEFFGEINKDKLNTPAGKKEAIKVLAEQIQLLQAQNKLQKMWNGALVKELAKHNIIIDEVGEETEG